MPKVICLDIESSPILGYAFGVYEQNLLQIVRDWQLLSFAWKELESGPVHCIARPDFKDRTDKSLTKAVWKVLDEADVVIAHYGDRFDLPKLRAKFIEHGLPPPRPAKQIDTKKIAKSQFAFSSNKLNDLGVLLKIGKKLPTGGYELWEKCMDGDRAAWAKMRRYNAQDVALLEKCYLRLRSWYPSHPNFALMDDRPGCPVCSSTRVQHRGYNAAKIRKSFRFQCQECKHWFSRSVAA